jgi:membrane protein implicated in regulation of membrane protease activity
MQPRGAAPDAGTDRFGHPAADPASGAGASADDSTAATEALGRMRAHFAELTTYVRYFIAAKADGLKVTGRNIGIYAALGLMGLAAGLAFIVTTVVLICVGIAAALVSLFNGSIWAGTLVAGILFITLLAGGIFLGMRMITRASRERTVKKYASLQQQQRAKFGTDVERRSGNPAR